MKNPKIIQIAFGTAGGVYGIDEAGNTWFAAKPEGKPSRWNIYIKNDEPREI